MGKSFENWSKRSLLMDDFNTLAKKGHDMKRRAPVNGVFVQVICFENLVNYLYLKCMKVIFITENRLYFVI